MPLFQHPAPDRLTPFSAHATPSDLAVDEKGELYWKNKRLRRSNLNWGAINTTIVTIAAVASSASLALANLDRIRANLGFDAPAAGQGAGTPPAAAQPSLGAAQDPVQDPVQDPAEVPGDAAAE